MKKEKPLFDIEKGEIILFGRKKYRLLEKADKGSYFNILIEAVNKSEVLIIRKVDEFATFRVVER